MDARAAWRAASWARQPGAWCGRCGPAAPPACGRLERNFMLLAARVPFASALTGRQHGHGLLTAASSVSREELLPVLDPALPPPRAPPLPLLLSVLHARQHARERSRLRARASEKRVRRSNRREAYLIAACLCCSPVLVESCSSPLLNRTTASESWLGELSTGSIRACFSCVA